MNSSLLRARFHQIIISLIFVASALVTPVAAQEIDKYVSVSPAADWVNTIEPEAPNTDVIRDGGLNYLLYDRQNKYSRAPTETKFQFEGFFHYVMQLQTPSAVEDNSAITTDFDPAYQTVVFITFVVVEMAW